jgi:two-component system KDP operon response regulator KdpE
MTRILVVDDEPQILRAMRINLHAQHFDVDLAADGAAALRAAADQPPDLVILDLGLPDIDGVDLIRRLRTWTSVPIVVLSGRAASADKVAALDAGADDYITKPFKVNELLARVRAITRRATSTDKTPATVELGLRTIDLAERLVTDRETGNEIHLTPTEWRFLEILFHNAGSLVSQRQLLKDVWGPDRETGTHHLRQHMAALRRKLEPDPTRPRHLLTEPGMGYRFQP